MQTELKQVMEKLDAIKAELDFIKGHIADADYILTDDDVESLKAAEEDLKQGKTKRLI